MTRLRLALAALSLSLGACAVSGAHANIASPRSVVVETQTQLDRAALRTKLAERRAATFANFIAYRDARVYPVNQLPGGGFRHVWVDGTGNLCAAATLIGKDWGRDAAVRVGKANIEIKLADVKSGPVLEWMLTSGMTRAELVAIQLPGDTFIMDEREMELNRMFSIYRDVERQIRSLDTRNLDLAVDELMKNPALARQLLKGKVAGPGGYGRANPNAKTAG